LSVKQVPFG